MKPLGSLIIIAAMSLGAQPQPDMAAACPTSLKALLALARSAPAEFSADAMIEIARSSLVSSSREKLALLEEASRPAAGAQEKVGLQWAYGGGPYSETHTAFIRGMDAVSLQARVVRAASDI